MLLMVGESCAVSPRTTSLALLQITVTYQTLDGDVTPVDSTSEGQQRTPSSG